MTGLLAALCGFLAALVLVLAAALWKNKKTEGNMLSITRFMFLTTQAAALCWVSVSYMIALYATIRLGQVFPVVELSQQAITTILGVNIMKVAENIFEHNNGGIFGNSEKENH